jgi:hypothetical protein
MKIELTDEQERDVEQGRTVEVVDTESAKAFVILSQAQYEQMQSLLKPARLQGDPPARADIASQIPPGIRRSQEAYWRELPGLLKMKSRKRQWVAYHGDERVGFGRTSAELYRECMGRRGLKKDEFYVDRLEPRPLPPWEAEEVVAPFPWGEALVEPTDGPA